MGYKKKLNISLQIVFLIKLDIKFIYIVGVESEDEFVQRVARAVREAKKNREWRREYMKLLMRDQENIEKGKAEGIIEVGFEVGLSEGEILERLQNKLNISLLEVS